MMPSRSQKMFCPSHLTALTLTALALLQPVPAHAIPTWRLVNPASSSSNVGCTKTVATSNFYYYSLPVAVGNIGYTVIGGGGGPYGGAGGSTALLIGGSLVAQASAGAGGSSGTGYAGQNGSTVNGTTSASAGQSIQIVVGGGGAGYRASYIAGGGGGFAVFTYAAVNCFL